jgi:hypothetical protein
VVNDDRVNFWAVISDLMIADSGTVLISQGSNAVISLKAKANVPKLNLANIDANFDVVYQEGMNTNIICQNGLTPLFKVRRIDFWDIIFGHLVGVDSIKAPSIGEPFTLKEIEFERF